MIPIRENPLKWGAQVLSEAGVDTPSLDAAILLEHCVGQKVISITASKLSSECSGIIDQYAKYIHLRSLRKPVAKIIEKKEFWGRSFYVNEDVLDPRPDTETIVEEALSEKFCDCIDLGTGSGAILVTLLAERINATGVGTDISIKSLEVAKKNLHTHGVNKRATLINTSWFKGLINRKFDLIISNPPYITELEFSQVSPEVGFYEPQNALCLSQDGLLSYKQIAKQGEQYLLENGRLIIEIGMNQEQAVNEIFQFSRLIFEKTLYDINNKPRGLVYRNHLTNQLESTFN